MKHKSSHPGIVIGTQQLRESDLIVSILTKDLGKISCLIRGARNSKKRFMGGVEVFDCGVFEIQKSKTGHLHNANSISERQIWPNLRKELSKYNLALYAIELISHFAADEELDGAKLFNPLFHCLRASNQTKDKELLISINTLYYLIVLQLSGLDPLHSKLEFTDSVKSWWIKMLEKQTAMKPNSPEQLKESLFQLNKFIVEIIGHQLKTEEQLMSTLHLL